MQRSSSTTWIIGTVLVALLLSAGAWFLLISPTLSTAAETAAQADQVEAANDQTVIRIARLKEQFAEIDTYKAQLAAMQAQIPQDAALSAYLRQLDEVATAHQVTLISIAPSSPATFAPAAAAVATDEVMSGAGTTSEASDDSASTSETATSTAVTSAAAASAAPAGMADVAVTLTAVGSYDNVLAFLDSIQQTDRRLFLATTVTGTALDDEQATGGRPETHVGDLEVTVSGYVFLLPTTTTTVPAADAGTETPALPGASPGKNPLVPVG